MYTGENTSTLKMEAVCISACPRPVLVNIILSTSKKKKQENCDNITPSHIFISESLSHSKYMCSSISFVTVNIPSTLYKQAVPSRNHKP
jgi:hypothetical protein